MRFYALIAFSSAAAACNTTLPLYGASNLPIDTSIATDFEDVLGDLTKAFDRILQDGIAEGQPIPANETSFSFAVFDKSRTLYTYHHIANESALAPESTKQVDNHTVYRIGSTSKLLAVYTFLISAGWTHWHSPITEYIPELAQRSRECSAEQNPVDCINWDEITLEILASQLSGIPDDFEPIDAVAQTQPVVQRILPPSILSAAQQECYGAIRNNSACTSSVYISGLANEHPVLLPWSQPSYSNAAFQLLAAALENITNTSFPDLLQTKVFNALNMTDSFSSLPPSSVQGIIPFNLTASAWKQEFLRGGPEGGIYSSAADLVKLGQGIMDHSLLSAVRTRQWMKPLSHTASLRESVGAPWEILRRSPRKGDDLHSVDLYTKAGDIGLYHVNLALIPEYEIGYTILAAGTGSGLAIDNAVVDVLLNGLDDIAHKQAKRNIARTYSSQHGNSCLTIAVESNAPGVNVTALSINRTDFREILLGGQYDLRAYPMGLSRSTTNGTTISSWRMLSHPGPYKKSETQKQELQDAVWLATSGQVYGYTGINEMLVETERCGRVVSITLRVFNETLV